MHLRCPQFLSSKLCYKSHSHTKSRLLEKELALLENQVCPGNKIPKSHKCLNNFEPADTDESFVVNHWQFNDFEKSNYKILRNRKTSHEIVALNEDILFKVRNDLRDS